MSDKNDKNTEPDMTPEELVEFMKIPPTKHNDKDFKKMVEYYINFNNYNYKNMTETMDDFTISQNQLNDLIKGMEKRFNKTIQNISKNYENRLIVLETKYKKLLKKMK